MIEKIISGGQTGADQGGLRGAEYLGIPTGGTAPKGFVTEVGPNILLRDRYNLTEGEPDPKIYPKRTEQNVIDSDGTVIYGKLNSPGTVLTANLCRKHLKPVIFNPTTIGLRQFVVDNHIKVLNVAGNRESRNPGIQIDTAFEIVKAFEV